MSSKTINTVKSKSQLQSLLSKISKGKSLLQQWIELAPIYVGGKTKADYGESIHKHLIESADLVKIDGHWCEFGVRSVPHATKEISRFLKINYDKISLPNNIPR